MEDVSFLNALKMIIESKASKMVSINSATTKERINSAREQLKNGQTISNDDLQKRN